MSFSKAYSNSDSSIRNNEWPENRIYYRKRHYNDTEYNDERASFNKRELSQNLRNKVLRNEQPIVHSIQQTKTFLPYDDNYNDYLHVDISRHSTSYMMSSMNIPCSVNSFKNISMNRCNSNQSSYIGSDHSDRLDILHSSTSSAKPHVLKDSGKNLHDVGTIENHHQYESKKNQENSPSIKNTIQLTKGVLYSENPNDSCPVTRDRPLGCKTAFVHGLPEKITEEILRDIFQHCGVIETIVKSKENFCYVTFSEESFVDNAVSLSGYKFKIENEDGAHYTGMLHVDYAQNQNGQHDYEYRQQHQDDGQGETCSRPSSPSTVYYRNCLASKIRMKLRHEDSFLRAASILLSWLEKGECVKENANNFFDMIKSAHYRVANLWTNKMKCIGCQDMRSMLKKQLEDIIHKFNEMEKIYKAALSQKCWELFTENQKKLIDKWKKEDENSKNIHLKRLSNGLEDEDMEFNNGNINETSMTAKELRKQLKKHCEKEKDSLKRKLVAAESAIAILESDHEGEIKCYTDEIPHIRKMLKDEDTFIQGADILISWLKKGVRIKKIDNTLFNLISTAHHHVTKLRTVEMKSDGFLNKKNMFKKQLETIIQQFSKIEEIYETASLQKCWNQFTENQKNTIDVWRKGDENLKNIHLNRLMNGLDYEMELDEMIHKTNTE